MSWLEEHRAVPMLILSLSVASCSPSHRGASPIGDNGSDRVLRRGNGPDPDSLDPQRAQTFQAQTILRDICEGLTTLSASGQPVPGMSSDWAVSADGLHYRFTLRRNARWSNGERVSARDVILGLRRLVDPATASANAGILEPVLHAQEITEGKRIPAELGVIAISPSVLDISLAHPAPYLPAILAHPSTCPFHETSPSQSKDATTNGAYDMVSWLPGDQIVLRRNPLYWNNAKTTFDQIQYINTTDENSESLRYRSGSLDLTQTVPRREIARLAHERRSELHLSPQLATYYYGFNLDRLPFRGNPKLRQALSRAIDRSALVRSILDGAERPAYSWIPPSVANYSTPSDARGQENSELRLAAARKLYAEAGYSVARPLRFELRYNSGEIHTRIALAVTQMWKIALGVEATPVAEELKVLLDDIGTGQVSMFRSSWSADFNDPMAFLQIFRTNAGANSTHYRNPAFDALLDRADRQPDLVARSALLVQAERLLLSDAPVIPLYFYASKHLVSARITGWTNNPLDVTYSKDLGLAE